MIVRTALTPLCLGALGAAAGIAAALTDTPALGLVAGALALGAGGAGVVAGNRRAAAEARAAHLAAESDGLETALAAQLQARLEAEEQVRGLGFELATTERAAARPDGFDVVAEYTAAHAADALKDPDTGLFSEEFFRVSVESRIAAARRHLRPVGIVLLEVVEGLRTDRVTNADPVLVADTVTETLREADTACRMDDGRFGLVLEDTSENGAIWTVERIRRQLVERRPGLTMRAGIACYPAHAFNPGELLGRAHEALDSAREWHQDRIEVATVE
jgi:diguanylate cyclase (GGDEF)-like protein